MAKGNGNALTWSASLIGLAGADINPFQDIKNCDRLCCKNIVAQMVVHNRGAVQVYLQFSGTSSMAREYISSVHFAIDMFKDSKLKIRGFQMKQYGSLAE